MGPGPDDESPLEPLDQTRPEDQPPSGPTSGAPDPAGAVYAPDDYVGVGRRFVALVIDSFILSVIVAVFALPSDYKVQPGGVDATLSGIIGLLGMIYYVGMEGSQGATLGKMALRIHVTMEDGAKATWGAAFLRNVLRIIDGLFAYSVGAILIWTSAKRQRLGDRIGKTVVVHTRQR